VASILRAPAYERLKEQGHSVYSLLTLAVGIAFAVDKALGKSVLWEEAYLLHALRSEANFHGFVPETVAKALGPVLMDRYGYKKDSNSNEIEHLHDKLAAFGAIEERQGGYVVKEQIFFWERQSGKECPGSKDVQALARHSSLAMTQRHIEIDSRPMECVVDGW
jgi:hypothetical protein